MRSIRSIRSIRTTLGVTAVLGLAVASPAGDIYHFTADEGYWKDPPNWEPWGVPGADDTAIIDAGNHCIVKSWNRRAKIIEVQETVQGTARLTIKDGYWLFIGSKDEDTTSTINGELEFQGTGSKLIIEQSADEDPPRKVTITSTDQVDGGLIIANGAQGHDGWIDWNR